MIINFRNDTAPRDAQIREPRSALRRPGYPGAGQKEILGDATALAFNYLSASVSNPSDLRIACWVIRDFGTDDQFGHLVVAVRRSQYDDRHRYDLLWSGTIWSDNTRERVVLDLMLADQRIYQADQRYSDIARGELARIEKNKQGAAHP